jgi:hypothetical protein
MNDPGGNDKADIIIVLEKIGNPPGNKFSAFHADDVRYHSARVTATKGVGDCCAVCRHMAPKKSPMPATAIEIGLENWRPFVYSMKDSDASVCAFRGGPSARVTRRVN